MCRRAGGEVSSALGLCESCLASYRRRRGRHEAALGTLTAALTAPQLLELWWPTGAKRVGQKRLTKLFQAGQLEPFRPVARRGSFPWTYHLGEHGHRLLQDAGVVDLRARYRRRLIYDYSLVLHELQLNSWALACRRLLGDRLLDWQGETDISSSESAAGL